MNFCQMDFKYAKVCVMMMHRDISAFICWCFWLKTYLQVGINVLEPVFQAINPIIIIDVLTFVTYMTCLI